LPWDKIELLDFFLESLIFSTPLGEETLHEAANTGRIAEYTGWTDEVNRITETKRLWSNLRMRM
jgi:hypothetical protein